MIYFKALVGTMFLMVIVSVFVEGVAWLILDVLNASKTVIISSEAILLVPLAIGFAMLYKTALRVERDMEMGQPAE